MSLFQMNSGLYDILIALVLSLVIVLRAGLNMVLTAGFMFYDFFGVAVDVFYTFSFVVMFGIFFIIWRATR